jgi:hypothetical protein
MGLRADVWEKLEHLVVENVGSLHSLIASILLMSLAVFRKTFLSRMKMANITAVGIKSQ